MTSIRRPTSNPWPGCVKCDGSGIFREGPLEPRECPCLTAEREFCADCGRVVIDATEHVIRLHADYGLTADERAELRAQGRRNLEWVRARTGYR